MLHQLAAPHLYKEPVIGSLERFFFGSDAPVLATAHTTSNGTGNGSGPHVVHKRDLFKLVEAVHVVYTPEDTTFYRATPRLEVADMDEQQVFDELVEKVDVSRYTNIPDSIANLPLTRTFPKLARASINSWSRYIWDHVGAPGLSELDGCGEYGEFERYLGELMYQFTPATVCRMHACEGPFMVYPLPSEDTKVSVLHEMFEGRIVPSLVPSAKILLHDDIREDPDNLEYHMLYLYRQLVETMKEWVDNPDISRATIQATEVIFVIHHLYMSEYDKGEVAMRQWYQEIKELETWLREYIAIHDPHPAERAALDGWDHWKIIPGEEYPFCPACQPEEYRNHQNSKTIASPSST
jgi:hypothetical protein